MALAMAASGGPADARIGHHRIVRAIGQERRTAPIVVTAQPQPPNTLPGVDVAHWQGPIDWAKVAASGQRFAIAKATEGQTYQDPMYAGYQADAQAQGLLFTAYHFARPDSTPDDAILEADHFVDVAQLGPGNLIPALDVERTGGLNPSQLAEWVLAWLGEVTARLGVKPMVYTSPNGWKNRFDDTTAVADAGYTVLWVAHWNVSSPTVPANDWDGHGWTIWQHTDCANVSGISGCVDHDWYDATAFDPIMIRGLTVSVDTPDGVVTTSPARFTCSSTCTANFDPGTQVTLTATPNAGAVFLGWGGACSGQDPTCSVTMDADRSVTASFATDTTPPEAAISPPSGLTGPVSVGFSEVVHGVTTANVVLGVGSGDQDVPTTLTCRGPRDRVVACSDGDVLSVGVKPVDPLVPGQAYSVTVDPAGATPIVDRAGNPAPTSTTDFSAPTDVEQDSPALSYAWGSVSDHRALGRSYEVERLAGATASFRFQGPSVTWYSVQGPAQGEARVSVDGTTIGTVNDYAASERFHVAHTFAHLGSGAHTITITALGRRGSARATDRLVAVDAFGVGSEVVRNPNVIESWRSARLAGGPVRETDVAGAGVSMTFRGTSVQWVTTIGPDQGKAEVYLDGTLAKTVNGYAASASTVARTFGGLADGLHTIRVVALGTSSKASTDALVTVDGFVVA